MKSSVIVLAGTCLLLASPALGQSLSERINYVMQQRAEAQTRSMTMGQMLSVLTYTDITVSFLETPARETFNYLQTVLGIPIIGRYTDDKVGHGIDPDTPITLDVVDKPALTVLELVLDQCEEFESTTWQLRNGFVEVGTKERLSAPAAREIKYYPIRDLLFEPPYFDNAPALDLATALNQTRQRGGGGGGALAYTYCSSGCSAVPVPNYFGIDDYAVLKKVRAVWKRGSNERTLFESRLPKAAAYRPGAYAKAALHVLEQADAT